MPGELIKIEKPDFHKVSGLKIWKAFPAAHDTVLKTENPAYLYWSDLKRKSWIPQELTPEEFWVLTKNYRGSRKRMTPLIHFENSLGFHWSPPTHYDAILHEIDLNMGGRLLGLDTIPEKKRQKYISRSLVEESIASAQLEGAHTTRAAAEKMIREGRPPADLGQRMIYNNYRAMRRIEKELKNEKLTLDGLLDLHALLTTDTLDRPEQAGRLRTPDEKIEVSSAIDGRIAHIPPPVDFVGKELKRLIAWANDELDVKNFTHPLIKAIILHFWIGYLHPFADGNGRLARALFYWYLLRREYWAFAFIPVSTRIKKSPKQYVDAYIYSEQDDNDLTYFIDYNIRQIELARKDFTEWIQRKSGEADDYRRLSDVLPDMNDRQLQLVQYLLTHPGERTNVTAMTRLYSVTPATAVKDLKTLEERDYLRKRKQGRNVFYYATDRLTALEGEL